MPKWIDVKANPACAKVSGFEESSQASEFIEPATPGAAFVECSISSVASTSGSRGAIPVLAYKLNHALVPPPAQLPLAISQKCKLAKGANDSALAHCIIRVQNTGRSTLKNITVAVGLRRILTATGGKVRRSRSQPPGKIGKDGATLTWQIAASAAGSTSTLQARFEIADVADFPDIDRLPVQTKCFLAHALSGLRVLGKVESGEVASCNARTHLAVAFS